MGKSASKIIQTLVLPYQPVRYVVTNKDKIVLVTYDYYIAKSLEKDIKKNDYPSTFILAINKIKS
jgi:hypothetical protein